MVSMSFGFYYGRHFSSGSGIATEFFLTVHFF